MADTPARNTRARSRSRSPTKTAGSSTRSPSRGDHGLRKRPISNGLGTAMRVEVHVEANGAAKGHNADDAPVTERSAKGKKPVQSVAEIDKHHDFEFGGSLGCGCMMVIFPCIMYYLWISMVYFEGRLAMPKELSSSGFRAFVGELFGHIKTDAWPTSRAWLIYEGLMIYQLLLALLLPGVKSKGLPLPSLQDERLEYHCNALAAWYVTLATGAALHLSGVLRMTEIIENFGSIMTVAILTGFLISALVYVVTIARGRGHRMSGHVIYDFFMGAPLNPRIEPSPTLQRYLNVIDIKMFFEVRVPWVLLFGIAVSAACKQYEQYGHVSPNLAFMVLATGLYINACAKGEELIPQTWDMFYEKFGFMLCFWNLAGVPFTYCYSIIYLASREPQSYRFSTFSYVALYSALLLGYYIFDTANAQKSRLRMAWAGKPVMARKYAFPQLPWSELDPERVDYIQTAQGNKLLTGGWWGIVRKPAYTGDLIQSLCWGLSTGLPWQSSVICYYYFAFFVAVLVHRTSRDFYRCKQKYGKDWDKYCQRVPYSFIPGLI